MTRYVAARVLQAIPTLIGLSIVAFLLVRLTGDPASVMLPPETPEEAVAEFRARYGLDRSVIAQYVSYVSNLATGDLGQSLRYNVPVSRLFFDRFPATLQLAALSMLIAVGVGVPLGVIGALKRGGPIDWIVRGIAFFGQAIPGFYFGLLLIFVFAVELRWVPTGGRSSWKSLILPSITLASYLVAMLVRFTRGAVLDVLQQPYVTTARAGGLTRSTILRNYVLRNAMIPIITIVGLQVGVVLSGAVVTEYVFNWPGIGRLMVDAISTRDFPMVQGMVVMVGVIFVLVNLMVDVMYSVADPRIRRG